MYGFGILAAASYLVGSLPGESISAKIKEWIRRRGFDPSVIRLNGSRWARIVSPVLGEIPTITVNTVKGLSVVFAARVFVGSQIGMMIAGLFAVMGHAWPFLGYSPRQKGISVATGAMAPIAPASLLIMLAVWVAAFRLTRFTSVSTVLSFGLLPLILYLVRHHDVFVIYGVLMSAMVLIQMAGGLARISEGKAPPVDEGGSILGEEDEADEDEPVRKKKTGLRVAAAIVSLLVAVFWFGNKYVYRGFGLQIGVVRGGSPDLKVIALTFDDGPDPVWTPKVLDILKENDVRATFFLVGRHVEKYPAIARRIVDEGHSVGNHSYSHLNMPLLSGKKAEDEIDRCEEAIENVCGVRTVLFRPPRGLAQAAVRHLLIQKRYTIVLWKLSSRDWAEPSYREIVSTCAGARGGDIILFHDSGSLLSAQGGSRAATVRALPLIIKDLRSKGFRFVTVDQLIVLSDLSGNPPAAQE
ncbi:MAG: polysaccharide deacetylase family protein [Firmicutes bacterium]|nr:polysaccharide deacetylase family protein [Bacillota bacterium]